MLAFISPYEIPQEAPSASPLESGTSTLQAAPGTKIYLTKKGKRDRVLLTLTPEIAGKKFDVTRL